VRSVRNHEEQRGRKRDNDNRFRSRRPPIDEKVKQAISEAESAILGTMGIHVIRGLNAFQRKMVHQHFEKTQEYKAKTYREGEDYILKVFPVGQLRRFAEQKAQEVLMKGESEILPPMGAFERFVVHDYLKDRGGIHTESFGEGAERHIEISPIFGRTLKKAKRRLSR
jgi:predicted RNA-binding protein Jag